MTDQAINDLIVSIASSIGVAIVTAYVTVRLSLRQFRSERWWEKKAEAYSRIVEALYAAIAYCEMRSHESLSGRDVAQETMTKLQIEYQDALRDLMKAAAIGSYLISSESATTLRELTRRPQLDWHTTAPFEFFDHQRQGFVEALEKIRSAARRDLKVEEA